MQSNESLTRAITNWRASYERRFVFNLSNAASAANRSAIHTKLAGRNVSLEGAYRDRRQSGRGGAALEPLYDVHRDFVLGARVLLADETPVAMLDPGAGGQDEEGLRLGLCARRVRCDTGRHLRVLPRPRGAG